MKAPHNCGAFFVLLLAIAYFDLCTMAIAHVTTWLDDPDPDYDAGVLLYNEFGSSNFLKSLFAKGASTYTWEKLREELILIANKREKEIQQTVIPKMVVSPQTPPKPLNTAHYPKELQLLIARKGEIYKKACFLHTQLENLGSDKERLHAAELITKYFKEIDYIWTQLDHFDEHKVMMKVQGYDHSRMSTYELLKRNNNLRTYISKEKAKRNDQGIINKYEEELAAVKQILDNRSIQDD